MGTKTSVNTVPTDYQAGLLLAALDDEHHRIPSNANGRTLDLMYARQWVKEYTATGRLASTVRDYPGFTHFRLTHHGINAARRVRALRDWSFIPGQFAVLQDAAPTVKARELVTVQGVPRRDGTVSVLVASTQSTRYVPVHHLGPLPIGPDALSLPETAVYVPQDDAGTGYRDVVILKGAPDADGKLQAVSGRYNGKLIRVPLVDLQPIPELPPTPAGDLTDWWSVLDRAGEEIARVQGADDPAARTAAERHPVAGPVSRRENGVAVRRLRTAELTTPVGELRGLPRTSPARSNMPASSGRYCTPRLTDTTATTRRSIPARPATVVYGALAANLAAPQVDAAIRLLTQACQPLAAFRDHHCVGSGAYLDPRMRTGEVVLTYLHEDAAAPASRAAQAKKRAVSERVLIRWADLFQAAGWEVSRYTETDRYDGYRLVRLILTPVEAAKRFLGA